MNSISEDVIREYIADLADSGKASGTIDDYQRYVRRFAAFLGERELTAGAAAAWKKSLEESALAACTVNLCISAVNSFLKFLGREDCLLRRLRIQQKPYREDRRDLDRDEFGRLVNAARRTGRKKEALIMETLCATGIRVSELRYITVEAAGAGRAEIALKGKIRVILIPEKLRRSLIRYAKECGLTAGVIFRGAAGGPMDRRRIWEAMKAVCAHAGVPRTKVFPHNLRHLFAVTFYRKYRDIAALADILGHSSTNTTRIYLITTGEEHARRLDELGLVS